MGQDFCCVRREAGRQLPQRQSLPGDLSAFGRVSIHVSDAFGWPCVLRVFQKFWSDPAGGASGMIVQCECSGEGEGSWQVMGIAEYCI